MSAPEKKAEASQGFDIFKYLCGSWKRNLEWREFGGLFQHLRTSNTVVVIEEFNRLESEPNTRYLRWSFGKTTVRQDLRFGYEMKVVSQPSAKSKEVQLEWQYSGTLCKGTFYPTSNVAILHFILRSSAVTVTYRIMDEDSMAVCIVEVDDKNQPTIQYGNMLRMEPSLYSASAQAL